MDSVNSIGWFEIGLNESISFLSLKLFMFVRQCPRGTVSRRGDGRYEKESTRSF
jgi:hypothetical protein